MQPSSYLLGGVEVWGKPITICYPAGSFSPLHSSRSSEGLSQFAPYLLIPIQDVFLAVFSPPRFFVFPWRDEPGGAARAG